MDYSKNWQHCPGHRVRFQLSGESEQTEILLLTEPNSMQSRAFDLLKLRPHHYLRPINRSRLLA